MGIAIRDAARLAGINRVRSERIEARRAALATRVGRESALFDERCRAVREEALAPVLAAFARLRDGDATVAPARPAARPPVVPAPSPAPAVRTAPWRGRSALRAQREIGCALSRSETALDLVEARWSDGLAHSVRVRGLLSDLQTAIAGRSPAFATLVDTVPVAAWTGEQRQDCATLVDLVALASALTTAPVDPTGAVTEPSRAAVADAHRQTAPRERAVA